MIDDIKNENKNSQPMPPDKSDNDDGKYFNVRDNDETSKKVGSLIALFFLIFNLVAMISAILLNIEMNIPSSITSLFGAIIFSIYILNPIINTILIRIQHPFRTALTAEKERLGLPYGIWKKLLYDMFFIFLVILLGIGNFMTDSSIEFSDNFYKIGKVLSIIGLFFPILLEIFFLHDEYIFFRYSNKRRQMKGIRLIPNSENPIQIESLLLRISWIVFWIFLIIFSIIGVVFSIVILTVAPYDLYITNFIQMYMGTIGIGVAPFAQFFGLAFYLIAFLAGDLYILSKFKAKSDEILKEYVKERNKPIKILGIKDDLKESSHIWIKRAKKVIISRRTMQILGALGIITSLIMLSSIIAIPANETNAYNEFNEVYGDLWNEATLRSDFNASSGYFLKAPVDFGRSWVPRYSENCRIIRDVVYFNETVDNHRIILRYDVYLPLHYSEDLPGRNSTIIRLHGGAWMFGDKGLLNIPQTSRYLASRGYIVFDLQYRLYNASLHPDIPEVIKIIPQDPIRIGNFTLDHEIRDISNALRHISKNNNEYMANLSSVFIMGGSAGGNLACAAALAISSGNYSTWFPSEIKIRGYIPRYPANDMCYLDGVPSDINFIEPKRLITPTSPPCLIFHGLHDGLVNPEHSEVFKQYYLKNNNPYCAVIYLKLATHGFDAYYSGANNQLMLYYAERFLYIFR